MEDGLSPTEAAEAARARFEKPESQVWHVVDLKTDESVVVEFFTGTTKGPNRSRVNGVIQDNVA